MTLRGFKNISLIYSLCGKFLSSCAAAGDRQIWKQQAALKMTCAKPPLESSRRLFKASFELKYQVFVVFSKTLLISILFFLFIVSIFMLSISFIILFFFLIFQFILSLNLPAFYWIFRIFSYSVQMFAACIAALMKICAEATQPHNTMKRSVHVIS